MPSRGALRHTLRQLASSDSLSAVNVWVAAAEWVAAGLLIEAIAGRPRLGWLLAAMAYLPMRLFMPDRGLSASEALGAALAVMVLIAWRKAAFRARAGAGMLLTAIALGELQPFHFSSQAQSFSWVPFGASLGLDWQPAATVLFHKTYDYGAAACLLALSGLSYRKAGAAIAAGLLLCETAQIWLPGRTPEITDPALALMLGFALSWLEARSPRAA